MWYNFGMIEFKGVSRTYKLGGETIRALDGVNLRINEGEFVAIMGPSGSGKSTFLNLIGGLDRPDRGKVFVESVDLATLRDRKLSKYRNKTIGFVFQNFNLQSIYTAIENVALPMYFAKSRDKEKKKRAENALRMVELSDRKGHKPSQLSGGQQQRVAVARALVNEPKILLADEPTGNLDSKNGKAIMQLLKHLNKHNKISIVMVTHDPEMARFADRVIKLKDGKVSSR